MYYKEIISILLLFSINFSFNKIETRNSPKAIKKVKCEAFFSVGGITQYGSIKKQDLLKQTFATIKWSPDCKAEQRVEFKIISFEIRVLINGSSQSAISNKAYFSNQQKELIKKMQVGGFIHFEQIKIIAPDGLRTMNPTYYKVD